jgi:hypothetical protein
VRRNPHRIEVFSVSKNSVIFGSSFMRGRSSSNISLTHSATPRTELRERGLGRGGFAEANPVRKIPNSSRQFRLGADFKSAKNDLRHVASVSQVCGKEAIARIAN